MTQPIHLIADLFAVEVPEGAINFTIDMGYLIYKVPNYSNWCNDSILSDPARLMKYVETHKAENDYKTGGILLPGSWQLICTSKECTEEVAKTIAQPFAANLSGTYRNHEWPEGPDFYTEAVASIRSLVRSKGLDPDKTIIIKKVS